MKYQYIFDLTNKDRYTKFSDEPIDLDFLRDKFVILPKDKEHAADVVINTSHIVELTIIEREDL